MPQYFAYIFPFFFVGLWILVSYLISRMGWKKLADSYRYDQEFTGEKIGVISVSINSTNYNNSMIVKCNYEGIYLKPVLIFSLFHPPLLIPWREIRDVTTKRILFLQLKEMIIGSEAIAVIRLKSSDYEKLRLAAPARALP